MRVVVLSDTHVRAGGSTRLSDGSWAIIRAADLIVHCGDVVDHSLLDELRAIAPVHAVLGNNDVGLDDELPIEDLVELAGVRVGILHDSGPTRGRAARLARRFPDCDVVLFGHSHIPVCEPGLDGQLLLNPGSATQRRRQPHRTLAVLELARGRVRSATIVDVDP